MFKKITNKVTSSVKNTATSSLNSTKNKAVSGVKSEFKGFVSNLKKVNKKISAPLIENFDDFKSQWEAKSKEPEQTILLFLMASYHYAQGQKELGEWMATVVLPKTHLLADSNSPTKFKLNMKGDGYFLEHMAESPRTVNSYLGGTPQNNYEIDKKNLVMHIVSEGKTDTDTTIHIQSAGKDFSSPCNLRKNNDGQWKLFSIGSIATGVKQTDQEKGDF